MNLKSPLALLAVGALAAFALTSCGDDDETTADASGSGEGSGATADAPTGDPVRLMVIAGLNPPPGTFEFPEAVDAAEAAAEAVNAAGGIQGRPVEILSCDSKNQPNESADCGREAVEEGVIAVVGAADAAGGYFASLESAEIPSVGARLLSQADYTSPMAFPVASSPMAIVPGMVTVLPDLAGSEDVAFVYTDTPTISRALEAVDEAMDLRGLDYERIPVPVGSPDMAPFVAQATSGDVDGVAISMGTDDADKVVAALRQSGYDGAISRSAAQLPPESIETLGEAVEGVYLSGDILPPTSEEPEVQDWVDAMTSFDDDMPLTGVTGTAYAAVLLVAEALESAPSVDSASLLAALTAPDATFETGLFPTSQFTEAADDESPRVFNTKVIYGQVSDGEVVLADGAEFFDPVTGEPSGA